MSELEMDNSKSKVQYPKDQLFIEKLKLDVKNLERQFDELEKATDIMKWQFGAGIIFLGVFTVLIAVLK